MKKNVFFAGILAMVLVFVLTGCVSMFQIAAGVSAIKSSQNVSAAASSAGPDESIVVVKRSKNYSGSAVLLDIFVDGKKLQVLTMDKKPVF